MNCKNKTVKPGMAYVYVILAFTILMILLSCIISMFYANLNMAKLQEKQTQAYYVALSGIELGRAALLQEATPNDDKSTMLYKQYSTNEQNDINKAPILGQRIKMDEGDGWTDIIVFAFMKDGKRWVKIYSAATLEDSNVTKTLSLSFPVDNPKNTVWDRN